MAALFGQGLRRCQAAGLVKLGHVGRDGTKGKANAAQHKARSYARMAGAEQKREQAGPRRLEQAAGGDAAAEARYGKGQRGEELPAELARRESRRRKLREAKAALAHEAKAQAPPAAAAAQATIAQRPRREAETGQKAKGRAPLVPAPEQAQPDPKAQRTFTEPAPGS